MDVLKSIFDEIKPILAAYEPPMVTISNYESRYELYTDKAVEIDVRKKPNLAFAALIIQTGYVGFYFMPIYTNVEIKEVFKPELLVQIRDAMKIGFNKCQENGWV